MKKIFDKVLFVVGIVIVLAFILGSAAETLWYYDEEILTASVYGMFGWFMAYGLRNLWEKIRD